MSHKSLAIGTEASSGEKQEKWNRKHLVFSMLSDLKSHHLLAGSSWSHSVVPLCLCTVWHTKKAQKKPQPLVPILYFINYHIVPLLVHAAVAVCYPCKSTVCWNGSCSASYYRQKLTMDSNNCTVFAQHPYHIPGKQNILWECTNICCKLITQISSSQHNWHCFCVANYNIVIEGRFCYFWSFFLGYYCAYFPRSTLPLARFSCPIKYKPQLSSPVVPKE